MIYVCSGVVEVLERKTLSCSCGLSGCCHYAADEIRYYKFNFRIKSKEKKKKQRRKKNVAAHLMQQLGGWLMMIIGVLILKLVVTGRVYQLLH